MKCLAILLLKERRKEFVSAINRVSDSLESLENKESLYANEHRILIETYMAIIKTLDEAISDWNSGPK